MSAFDFYVKRVDEIIMNEKNSSGELYYKITLLIQECLKMPDVKPIQFKGIISRMKKECEMGAWQSESGAVIGEGYHGGLTRDECLKELEWYNKSLTTLKEL